MNDKLDRFIKTASLFGIITLCGIVLHQVLFKGHIFASAPIFCDDFTVLSSTLNNFHWKAVRPISFIAIWLLGFLGEKFLYPTVALITVSYFTAVFSFVARFLQLPKIPLPLILFAACAVFSFEYATWAYHCVAVVAGPITGMLALAAMTLIYNSMHVRTSWKIGFGSALLLGILALLTREDFLLPLLLFCFYLGFIEQEPPFKETRERARIAFIFFLLTGIAILFHQLFVLHSPYLSGQGVYKNDVNIAHVLGMAVKYLTCTTGAQIATAVQFAALLTGIFLQKQISVKRVLLLHAMILSLVAPYGVLTTAHFFEFYAFNWIPWQYASTFIVVNVFAKYSANVQRMLTWSVSLLMTPAIIWATQPIRSAQLTWLTERSNITEHVLQTLSLNSDRIKSHDVVALTGTPVYGPWTFTDAEFLKNKMGFNCRWMIFANPSDEFYKANQLCEELLKSNQSDAYPAGRMMIVVHKLAEIEAYPHPATLELMPDGSGHFVETQ